jgi:hypothetical protein
MGPVSEKIYGNNAKNISPPFAGNTPWNNIIKE